MENDELKQLKTIYIIFFDYKDYWKITAGRILTNYLKMSPAGARTARYVSLISIIVVDVYGLYIGRLVTAGNKKF